MHSSPLPRLGGVAIFLSFFICMAVAAFWEVRHPQMHSPQFLRTMVRILIPAGLVFLLGVYDDLRGLGPYFKFTVQGIAATMLYAGGLRIINIPVVFGDRVLPWYVGWAFTVIWVLAITNAFNLIDGLDGLAAGSALFSTMVVFVVALLNGPTLVEVMTIALAGAILGFLRFNFNPATIFLGDSGSLFIGFLLSALALFGAVAVARTELLLEDRAQFAGLRQLLRDVGAADQLALDEHLGDRGPAGDRGEVLANLHV